MFQMMLRKLLSKKWMSACLMTGILLLIATAVSFPIYRGTAYDRMLSDEFRGYLSANGEWPALNKFVMISGRDAGGRSISRVEGLMEEICERLGVTEKETIYYYSLAKTEAESLMKRKDLGKLSLRLGFLSDLPEHAGLLAGEMYSEDGVSDDGCLEAVMSQSCMVDAGLLVGETILFPDLKAPGGDPVRVRITGVFQEAREKDFYWQKTPEDLKQDILVSEKAFREYFTGERAGGFTITCNFFSLFEYEDIKAAQVNDLMEGFRWLSEESPYRNILSRPAYADILDAYSRKLNRIDATLFLLQIPVLILLGAFLFMISAQMYDMERNDISVMKSRGASGGQLFRLYFYQSCFLTMLGAAAGVPLGSVFAGVLGSARSFLEFDLQGSMALPDRETVFSVETLVFTAAAMVICILVMTLPAIKHSRVSIVDLKRQKARRKRSWWELGCLDMVCLAIALYGYFTCTKNQGAVVESVLRGEAMDPLQYVSSSLFILGAGLLALRLQPLLIKCIYLLGRRFWRPASYISFLENEKNGRKQQFIMLFLIMAVSLGMFHAAAARTILQNALENTAYLDGADMIVREVWRDNSTLIGMEGAAAEFRYYEPDYDKFARLESAAACTKVIYDTEASVDVRGGGRQGVILMGIHTRQFGENTWMPEGLMDKPYYEYLNELALNPDGVLVSADFRDIYGYAQGDIITYRSRQGNQARGKILDFFTYWPGYASSEMKLYPDGSVGTVSCSMIVAPITTLTSKWGTVPYEVWMSARQDADPDEFYRWIQEEKVRLVRYVDREADMEAVTRDPLLQGTNGILTMGYLVIILLCAVGYLIYWILSIRSREMIFGILRANGMHKGEIFHILINEQIFCGGFSVAVGISIGKLVCRMFVPILQTAYAASNQVLPMRLITNGQDMVKLYGVTAAVLAVCLMVLFFLVQKLNVAKALKMGEE